MPLIHSDLPASGGPRISVRLSVAIELEWALTSGDQEDYRQDNPALAAVYDAHRGLTQRVQAIWGAEEAMSCGGHFLELMILAHHGGLLFSTDAEALLDRLDHLCATAHFVPGDLPLLSETPRTAPRCSSGWPGSASPRRCGGNTSPSSATCGTPYASSGS